MFNVTEMKIRTYTSRPSRMAIQKILGSTRYFRTGHAKTPSCAGALMSKYKTIPGEELMRGRVENKTGTYNMLLVETENSSEIVGKV